MARTVSIDNIWKNIKRLKENQVKTEIQTKFRNFFNQIDM